MIRRMRFRVRW